MVIFYWSLSTHTPSSFGFLSGFKLVPWTRSLVDPNPLQTPWSLLFSTVFKVVPIQVFYYKYSSLSHLGKLSEIAIFAIVNSTVRCAGS